MSDQGWTAFERGSDHFRAGELADAIAAYEEAIRHMPTESRAHFNLGIACLHMGDRIGGVAIEAADGTHARSANDAWYVRAIAAFTRAHELEPDHAPTLHMRGQAHRKRLDDASARADFVAADRLGDPYAKEYL